MLGSADARTTRVSQTVETAPANPFHDAVALVRDGRTARHIGPVFAETNKGALTLVDAIVRSEQGPWLLDAVSSQETFLRGLTDTGWTIERPFQRMRFGPATAAAAELPFAVAGPEFG